MKPTWEASYSTGTSTKFHRYYDSDGICAGTVTERGGEVAAYQRDQSKFTYAFDLEHAKAWVEKQAKDERMPWYLRMFKKWSGR